MLFINLKTEFSPKFFLLLAEELREPLVNFTSTTVLSFIEREKLDTKFDPEKVTAPELASILDDACTKITADLAVSLKTNGFEFAVPTLRWETIHMFVLLLEPASDHGAPSIQIH